MTGVGVYEAGDKDANILRAANRSRGRPMVLRRGR